MAASSLALPTNALVKLVAILVKAGLPYSWLYFVDDIP